MTSQPDVIGTGESPVPADITEAELLLQEASRIADPLSSAVVTFRAVAHVLLYMAREEAVLSSQRQ